MNRISKNYTKPPLPLRRRGIFPFSRSSVYPFILLFLFCGKLYAQEFVPNENKWQEYMEELAEESEENSESIENLYNDLSYLTEHPINLNTVTAEQLKQIPFLSDLQILNILDYLRRNGQFVSIYELKNIDFLDISTIELILPFLYVGEKNDDQRPINLQNLSRYGKNELMLRYDRGLEQKAGYKDQPDSILQQFPNRKYVGEPFYTSFRYSFTFEDKIQAGLTAEKDAGESFLQKAHKGYDFYSAHVFLKNMGKISSLALGDYKISFGQGLVVSNDFRPSRSSVIAQAERRSYGFRRHYSTNETDFFRGVASSVAFGNLDVSAFYSYRKADATVQNEAITSFKTDGMHRTVSDMDKRYNIDIQTFGGNVRYLNSNLSVGITALTYSFGNLPVEPEPQPYNLFYFRGKRNFNGSIDYTLRNRRLLFFGETAISQNGALATLNAVKWNVSTVFNALILYRNYSLEYQAFYGNSFSQNTTVQNEEGVYLSIQWSPMAHWRLTGYADFYRFPWLKFGVDAPSSGREYMLQADYKQIKNTTVSVRYRFRSREENRLRGNENTLEPSDTHRFRLQISHKPSRYYNLRTTFERSFYENSANTNKGWLISQNFGYNNAEKPFKIDVFAAYFNTDDFNSRIYAYEKNLLYSFSIPSFYGEGVRLSSVLRYDFSRNFYASLKAAWAHYFDRDSIGTGLEEIA
ncbi:MAG: helix-hairpin-helix domain-containing protein, partial [Tannerella sp.]|nr:helix-hairpin-helix domain-containing protein [Tannerella sp.]